MLRTLSSLLCFLAAVPIYAEVYELTYWRHMGEVPLGGSREVVHRLCAVEENTQPIFVEVQLVKNMPGWSLQIGNRANQANDFPALPSTAMQDTAMQDTALPNKAMNDSMEAQSGAGIIDNSVVTLPPGRCTHLTMTLQPQSLGKTEANVRLNRLDCTGTPQECSQSRVITAWVVAPTSTIRWKGEIVLPTAADKAFFTGDADKLRLMTGTMFQDFRMSAQNPDFRYIQGNAFNSTNAQLCNLGEYIIETPDDGLKIRIWNEARSELIAQVAAPPCKNKDGIAENEILRVVESTCSADVDRGISGRVEGYSNLISRWVSSCRPNFFGADEARVLCGEFGWDSDRSTLLRDCDDPNFSQERSMSLDCDSDAQRLEECDQTFPNAQATTNCNAPVNGVTCLPFIPVNNGCSAPGSAVFQVCDNVIQYTNITSLIDGNPLFTRIENFRNLGKVINWFSPYPNRLYLVNGSMIAQFDIQGRTATLERMVPLDTSNPLITGRANSDVIYLSGQDRTFIDRLDFSASVRNMVEQRDHDRLSGNRMMSWSENNLFAMLHNDGSVISVFSESGAERLSLNSFVTLFFILVGGLWAF